jgi:hypothetical protein
VRCAEGVVHVDIAQAGQLPAEGRVVGLFLGVEAQVFEQQGLTRLEVGSELKGDGPDAVRRKGHVLVGVKHMVQQRTQARGDGPQAHRRDLLALGPAQVRGEDHLRLAPQGVLDGGNRLAKACVVGDGAVFGERHIEVDADEHTLASQVEIANGELRHRRISECLYRIQSRSWL